jgi:hypothetical protein
MKCLILVAVVTCLVLADDCANPSSDQCDPTVLACCDNNFKAALGIDCNNKQIYQNPDCITNTLNDYYSLGEAGALNFCNSFNAFRSCLGPSARSCTSYKYFLENKAPLALAQNDQGLYSQLSFMCGAGLDTYLRNTEQVIPLFQSRGRDINLCSFKFSTNVRRQPAKACIYLQEFVSCLQLIFNDYSEFSWYMCELARSVGSPYASHCNVGCSSTP